MITKQTPGMIVSDFNSIATYIFKNKILVKGKGRQFPVKLLETLNHLLTHPLKHGFTQPQQKSFPHLHGLYWLLRASGLLRLKQRGKKKYFEINASYYQKWGELNDMEQYCNLLDIWWFHTSPEIIDSYGFQQEFYFSLLNLWGKFVRTKALHFKDYEDFMLNQAYGRAHIYSLLELFGLVKVDVRSSVQGTGWNVKTISPTNLGVQLIARLTKTLISISDKVSLNYDDVEGRFILEIKSQYPQWVRHFPPKEKTKFCNSTYVIGAYLGKTYEQIIMKSNKKFSDLADEILSSFEIEEWEHIYDFYYDSVTGEKHNIVHPRIDQYDEDCVHADKIRLGDIIWEEGTSIIFVFNYMAEQRYKIILEKVL